MQPEQIIIKGIKVSDYPDEELTVRGIFQHNHNWDLYSMFFKDSIRPVEIEEVLKMLNCQGDSSGYLQYYCEKCEEYRTVHFGCKGRLCTHCGKPHSDRWAKELSKKMFRVVHRHVVLSMPERLWPVFKQDRSLEKVMMDSAIETLNEVLSHALRTKIQAGAIVVLHPYGRDLEYRPHIHNLMTEGGFDRKVNFIPKTHIHYESMRKVWQYKLLMNLKKALPKTQENARLIDRLFKDYPNGFYAHLPPESRITSMRMVAKYIGRYIRHPAIADCRLYGYDGENVTFWYKDNQGVEHFRTMKVFDFIEALIQHIPEKQFKMIRHYGAYSRKLKKRYKKYLSLISITQQKLDEIGVKPHSICPVCKSEMELVWFRKPGPPESRVFGKRIQDWVAVGDRGPVRGICRA